MLKKCKILLLLLGLSILGGVPQGQAGQGLPGVESITEQLADSVGVVLELRKLPLADHQQFASTYFRAMKHGQRLIQILQVLQMQEFPSSLIRVTTADAIWQVTARFQHFQAVRKQHSLLLNSKIEREVRDQFRGKLAFPQAVPALDYLSTVLHLPFEVQQDFSHVQMNEEDFLAYGSMLREVMADVRRKINLKADDEHHAELISELTLLEQGVASEREILKLLGRSDGAVLLGLRLHQVRTRLVSFMAQVLTEADLIDIAMVPTMSSLLLNRHCDVVLKKSPFYKRSKFY